IEYPYRMTRAGFRLGALERDRMLRLTLGGRGDASGKPPRRAYYKIPNHVRLALEQRSPPLLPWALARARRPALRPARPGATAPAGALLRGVLDALRGRMGRSVEPPG